MNVDAWRKSLLSMKISLLSSFELSTLMEEQELLLHAWRSEQDVSFVGYKHNEGRRRMEDVAEVIDDALRRMETSDFRTAAMIYHETLRRISLYTLWAKFLEHRIEGASS